MASGWILTGLTLLTVLNLGCNQTATEPASPQNTLECVLIDATEPSLDLGVELQISVYQCTSNGDEGTVIRADAKNGTAAILLFDDSCGGNGNPRIRILDPGMTAVYEPLDCLPRPLCPDVIGQHYELPPGQAVPTLVPFTCTPQPSGVYTIVATFTFFDEEGATFTAEQRLDVYWDSDASTVKAIP